MSQPISSPPGPEYSDVTEFLTWVGDFLGDGHAEVLWAPSTVGGSVFTFYSLPTTGGGRDYFMSQTDQEPQIHQQDFNTKRNSLGWVGAFADAQHSSALFYDVTSDDWWLLRGQPTGGIPTITATNVGNTVGFGHAINDGRPFWTGDFDGDGLDEVLFYYPSDGHWFLGNIASNQLTWTLVATTPFSAIGGGYRAWSGKFTQAHQSEVLFALASGYWMLFTMSGSQLVSHGVGNTYNTLGPMNDGRPFWVGNFAGDGIDEILFYQPADDNWWMGRFVPGTSENPACAQLRQDIANLQTSIAELQAEQTTAVNTDDRTVLRRLASEITAAQAQLASKQAQMTQAGCAPTAPSAFGQLVWQFVGNTIGYGHGLTSDGRPFWVGRFSQKIQDEILFYYAAAGHWHRGILNGGTMQWTLAGTTSLSLGLELFSNHAGHAWAGDFDGDGLTELVYRVTNSPNFWMFDFSPTAVTGSQVYTPPSHPTTSKVPNVVGSGLAMAVTAIQSASLQPNAFALDGSIVNQIVMSQDPVGGVTVQQGAHVNLGCIGALLGVSTLDFFNCSNRRLHLWTSTDGDQTWNDAGYADPPADPSSASNCPSQAVSFSKRGTVDFVAVDAASFPDVAPDDSDFDAASMVFRAAIPGDPGGVTVTAGKSS